LPAGVRVTTDEHQERARPPPAGYGRGARMSFEQDEIEILGGLRHGISLGHPFAVRVGNSEWPKWEQVMAPDRWTWSADPDGEG